MATNLGDLTASINGLALNVKNDDGSRLSLESFIGWGSAPANLEVMSNAGSDGGWAGKTYDGPRSLSLGGNVHAASIEALSAKVDELIAAFPKVDVPLIVHEGGVTRRMMVRRDGALLTQWLSPKIARWSAQVVALDPRKYGSAITGTTGLPATSGGLAVPFTVPFTIASTVVSGNVTLVNEGNATAPVTLRLDGPLPGGCVVTHVTSGVALSFATSLPLGTGAFLTVDMEKRIVLENGNASRNGYVTARNWFGCDPGVNVYAFSGPSAAAGTLTVSSYSAWE